MEALTDPIGLRPMSLCPAMIDILDSQVELILVMLASSAVSDAAVGKDAQQRKTVFFEERQDAVVE
jgi:hypothetical protein